jgi:hypothetical protein
VVAIAVVLVAAACRIAYEPPAADGEGDIGNSEEQIQFGSGEVIYSGHG